MKKFNTILVLLIFIINIVAVTALEPVGSIFDADVQVQGEAPRESGIILNDDAKAALDGGEEDSDSRGSYVSAIGETGRDILGRETTIGGALCSQNPDWDKSSVISTTSMCLTNNDHIGVAYLMWEMGPNGEWLGSNAFLGEKKLERGDRKCFTGLTPGNWYHREQYYCDDVSVSCTQERSIGCGSAYTDDDGNRCRSDQVLRQRTCTPSGGSWEKVCGDWIEPGLPGCAECLYDGDCDSDEECNGGECEVVQQCYFTGTKACYNTDLWYFDSCGNRQNRADVCDNGCSGSRCLDPPQEGEIEGTVNYINGGVNKITGKITITNNKNSPQSGLLSMEVLTPTEQIELNRQGFQAQSVCERPEDVSARYSLQPGETASVTLTSSNLPPGNYIVDIATVTGCCLDGCEPLDPFNWNTGTLKTFRNIAVTGTELVNNCGGEELGTAKCVGSTSEDVCENKVTNGVPELSWTRYNCKSGETCQTGVGCKSETNPPIGENSCTDLDDSFVCSSGDSCKSGFEEVSGGTCSESETCCKPSIPTTCDAKSHYTADLPEANLNEVVYRVPLLNCYKYTCSEGGKWLEGAKVDKSMCEGETGPTGPDLPGDGDFPEDVVRDGVILTQVSNPVVTKTDQGTIKAVFQIRNDGVDMEKDYLIEIQPKYKGGLQAFVSDVQGTCNPGYPENVHKNFRLNANEEVTIELESPIGATGTYDLIVATTDSCCTDGTNDIDCKPVSLYGWSTDIASGLDVTTTSQATCGDTFCSGGENYLTCEEDCTSWNGDGICDQETESCDNAGADCQTDLGCEVTPGDETQTPPETYQPGDCFPTGSFCTLNNGGGWNANWEDSEISYECASGLCYDKIGTDKDQCLEPKCCQVGGNLILTTDECIGAQEQVDLAMCDNLPNADLVDTSYKNENIPEGTFSELIAGAKDYCNDASGTVLPGGDGATPFECVGDVPESTLENFENIIESDKEAFVDKYKCTTTADCCNKDLGSECIPNDEANVNKWIIDWDWDQDNEGFCFAAEEEFNVALWIEQNQTMAIIIGIAGAILLLALLIPPKPRRFQ